MRIHAARDLTADVWADSLARNGSAERVQIRLGVNRYAATAEEARRLAAELIAAAAEVGRTPETEGAP